MMARAMIGHWSIPDVSDLNTDTQCTSKNGYLRNEKYPKCIFGAFAHLGHFWPENKIVRSVCDWFCPTCATGEARKRLNNKKNQKFTKQYVSLYIYLNHLESLISLEPSRLPEKGV